MSNIPHPLKDPSEFQTWSLQYADRQLSPENEQAFERQLIESPQAAAAFRQALELDVAMFDCSHPLETSRERQAPRVSRIPSLQRADAEALDPRNMDDMQFVAETCREMTGNQERIRNISRRHEIITRGWRRYWLHAAAAACITIGLGVVLVSSLMNVPAGVASQDNNAWTPKNGKQNTPRKGSNSGNGHDDATGNPGDGSVVEDNTGNVRDTDGTTVANQNDERGALIKDQDMLPTESFPDGVLTSRDGDGFNKRENRRTAPPLELDATHGSELNVTQLWMREGDLKVRREAGRVDISLSRDVDPITRTEKALGGLLYLRAIDPMRNPTLKLTVNNLSLAPGTARDLQFVIRNKILGGKYIYLSLKDCLPELKGKVDVNQKRHVAELTVHKPNQFELRIDGHVVNLTEPLTRGEWENMYFGFQVSTSGSENDSVYIESVTLGQDGRKK